MARGANESPPGRAVWSLGRAHQPERSKVRELVAEGGIAECGLFFQEGRKGDAARGSVGPPQGAGETPGEADLDDVGQFRNRPQLGELSDAPAQRLRR